MAVPNMLTPLTTTNVANASEGPGAYSNNMWHRINELQDPILQMTLAEKFNLMSVWRPFVPVQVMHNEEGRIAESMTWKGVYAMEPNISPVGTRQIWFGSNFTDTYRQTITFEHYADKVTVHRYDDALMSYTLNGKVGLIPLVSSLLSESMVPALDILARNAHLSTTRAHWIHGGTISHGSTPSFAGIRDTDVFNLSLGRDVWESLAYEDIPFAANPNGPNGTLFCLTTPSMIKTVKAATTGEWRETHLYADPSMLLKYEVGMWDNTRFLTSRRNVLWNCGDIIAQTTIVGNYTPGDGAPLAPVDGVEIGRRDSGVLHAITLTSSAGFNVGDIVTIHTTRTNAYGVTNGVDYKDGEARVRQIVAINGNDVSFDKPLFKDVLNGTYVTRAYHIHTSTYIGGPAVVNAVGDPINVTLMPPIDDAGAMYRLLWSGRFKYQNIDPRYCHVIFHGGATPMFGIGTAP